MTELTPQQQQFVDAQVAAGLFKEPADVVAAALDLLQRQQEHNLCFRDQLSKGVASLEAGERVPWDSERIKQEGRQRLYGHEAPE